MAQRTLLQIINIAQSELGLPQSSSIVGNTSDQTSQQMYAFANMEIEELRQRKEGGWTALQTEYDLTIAVPTSTTGDISVNSAVITNIPSTTGITAGYYMVSGPYLLAASRVISVDSPTQVTLNMPATGTQAGASILFMKDTYPEPSDFDFFINRTWWDRTNRWELLGPDSPQLDQWHRSGIVTTGPRRHFRQIGAPGPTQLTAVGNNYRIWPPPGTDVTAPIDIVFEYQSRNSVFTSAANSTRIFNFTADTNIPVLDDRAVIMGVKWRFWQTKGFDWTGLRTDYDNYVERLIARDGGAKTLNMVTRINPIFISPSNVQDGFFPGPIGPNVS